MADDKHAGRWVWSTCEERFPVDLPTNGGPAFPGGTYWRDSGHPMMDDAQERYPGMTLRDWFAGQALQSLVASDVTAAYSDERHSRRAYEIADAMLRAREREQTDATDAR